MATTDLSTGTEVSGEIVNIIHVDNSGADPVRTVLALAAKDDVSITIDESSESFDPAAKRRTQRYRTTNTVTVEISQAMATDMDALGTINIEDGSGNLTVDPADREWGSDYYLEVAYNDSELDYGTNPGPGDFTLMHRFADIETVAGDIDPGSTPPTVSATFWSEGTVNLDAGSL